MAGAPSATQAALDTLRKNLTLNLPDTQKLASWFDGASGSDFDDLEAGGALLSRGMWVVARLTVMHRPVLGRTHAAVRGATGLDRRCVSGKRDLMA